MSQLIRNIQNHSIEVLSSNGIIYSLYEGKTIDGTRNTSSDIAFIMLDGYCDKLGSETFFIGYIFGCSGLYADNDNTRNDCCKYIFTSIDKWESKHGDILFRLRSDEDYPAILQNALRNLYFSLNPDLLSSLELHCLSELENRNEDPDKYNLESLIKEFSSIYPYDSDFLFGIKQLENCDSISCQNDFYDLIDLMLDKVCV